LVVADVNELTEPTTPARLVMEEGRSPNEDRDDSDSRWDMPGPCAEPRRGSRETGDCENCMGEVR
jgi:hypothetical protein